MLAAGAVVASGQAHPSRKVTTGAEQPGIRNLRQHRAGDDRPDTWYCRQPASLRIATDGLYDLLLQLLLVDIECMPLLDQRQQSTPYHLCDLIAWRFEPGHQLVHPFATLRRHDP